MSENMEASSESGEEEEEAEGVTREQSLAFTRDRRSNAGARMSKLLQAEDEDEFYKTTYGGFAEEEDDNDYRSEDSGSDMTDSDIDLDENDELKSDGEDEDGSRRVRRLVTKAYKEPKKESKPTEPKPSVPKPKIAAEKVEIIDKGERKAALRLSTAHKSSVSARRECSVREREARAAMLRAIAERKKVTSVRRLTQEELLAEAMVTEQINLRSLEMYQRLELEKKRLKVHRPIQRGPMIRFHSVTTTIDNEAVESDVNVDDLPNSDGVQSALAAPCREKCSRNFITFTDDSVFNRVFPALSRRPAIPLAKQLCPVTGLPARYFDPVTQTPYATIEAFKVLRAEYAERCTQAGGDRWAGGEEGNKRRSRSLAGVS